MKRSTFDLGHSCNDFRVKIWGMLRAGGFFMYIFITKERNMLGCSLECLAISSIYISKYNRKILSKRTS